MAAAGILSLVNALVHSRDAGTSVVPQGIVLSAVCAILTACGAKGGVAGKGGNRITLLREPRVGQPELRTVFIDHLHSSYGVVLVGDTLYVANTDAILAFNYVPA